MISLQVVVEDLSGFEDLSTYITRDCLVRVRVNTFHMVTEALLVQELALAHVTLVGNKFGVCGTEVRVPVPGLREAYVADVTGFWVFMSKAHVIGEILL